MPRYTCLLLLILSLVSFVFFCDRQSTNSDDSSLTPADPSSIMPFAEISQIPRGEKLYLHLNRSGFEIEKKAVIFDGLSVFADERLLLCHTGDDFPVGGGDSGTPLVTVDGKLVGALCYGYSYNNTQFEARVIEDVLSVANRSVNEQNNGPDPIDHEKHTFPYYFISGIRKELIERISRKEPGRFIADAEAIRFAQSNAGLQKNVSSDPKYGSTITIYEIYGDVLQYGALGTVCHYTGENIFAFGHRYDPITPIAAPVFLSDMLNLITSSSGAFKEVQTTEQIIGSLVRQNRFGVLIDPKAAAQTFPLIVTIKSEGFTPASYRHTIANSQSYIHERYLTGLAVGTLAYRYIYDKYFYEDLEAKFTIKITTEKGTYDKTGEASDTASWIDYAIWDYIQDKMLENGFSEHFNKFEIDIEIEEKKI